MRTAATPFLLKRHITTALLAFSFWSSGVFLIRGFASYDLWSTPAYLALLFIVSAPVAYASIVGVRRFISSQQDSALLRILASVLLLHGAALGFAPQLYTLAPSASLSATAWLLWFGGIVLTLIVRGRQ